MPALACAVAVLAATVYYGSLDGSKKPAVLTAQKVFDEIPEYKQIKERGLDEDDADYWVLLAKANAKFYAAVKKVADRDGYDAMVEKGSHAFESEPPDVTGKVIAALEK
jgi:hypothetical protein